MSETRVRPKPQAAPGRTGNDFGNVALARWLICDWRIGTTCEGNMDNASQFPVISRFCFGPINVSL